MRVFEKQDLTHGWLLILQHKTLRAGFLLSVDIFVVTVFTLSECPWGKLIDEHIYNQFSTHLKSINYQVILKTDYASQYFLEMGQTLSVSLPAVQNLDF